jgi:UDP-glucose 4-epimerase
MAMTHSFTHAFITGGAGFIGSNLADRLLADGLRVTVFDNFSTGMHQFLAEAKKNPNFTLVEGDNLDLSALVKAMQGCDFVFHLAANADVRFGTHHPEKDLQQNTIATFNVLEAMRHNNIRRIAFSSTGSIYGEPDVFPTPENAPFPIQTSLYGASKLAGESLISAYAEGYNYQGYIFRFVSVLGERYTHGHVFDFYQKLKKNPHQMEVLGNGKQRKSYMYVQDCLDAMLLAVNKTQDKVNIFNLGSDGYTDVNGSIGWITNYLGVQPQLKYTGGERGWIGDSPFIFLDTKKIQSLGWKPTLTIEQGVIKTLQWIQQNEWIYGQRAA